MAIYVLHIFEIRYSWCGRWDKSDSKDDLKFIMRELLRKIFRVFFVGLQDDID